jgi:hypothetical protein
MDCIAPPWQQPCNAFWQILVQLHAAWAVNELQPSLAMHYYNNPTGMQQ